MRTTRGQRLPLKLDQPYIASSSARSSTQTDSPAPLPDSAIPVTHKQAWSVLVGPGEAGKLSAITLCLTSSFKVFGRSKAAVNRKTNATTLVKRPALYHGAPLICGETRYVAEHPARAHTSLPASPVAKSVMVTTGRLRSDSGSGISSYLAPHHAAQGQEEHSKHITSQQSLMQPVAQVGDFRLALEPGQGPHRTREGTLSETFLKKSRICSVL